MIGAGLPVQMLENTAYGWTIVVAIIGYCVVMLSLALLSQYLRKRNARTKTYENDLLPGMASNPGVARGNGAGAWTRR